MVWQHSGLNELMVLGAGRLAALDPADGKTRWWVKGWGFAAITTPVADSEMLFVGGGGTGDPSEPLDPLFNWPKLLADYDANKDEQLGIAEVPESLGLHIRKDVPREAAGNYMSLRSIMSTFMDQDKDKKISKAEWDATLAFMTDRNNGDLFAAVRPGGQDDATKTHVAWETTKALPEMPSPLLYNDRLYLMKSGGLLSALNPSRASGLLTANGSPPAACTSPPRLQQPATSMWQATKERSPYCVPATCLRSSLRTHSAKRFAPRRPSPVARSTSGRTNTCGRLDRKRPRTNNGSPSRTYPPTISRMNSTCGLPPPLTALPLMSSLT